MAKCADPCAGGKSVSVSVADRHTPQAVSQRSLLRSAVRPQTGVRGGSSLRGHLGLRVKSLATDQVGQIVVVVEQDVVGLVRQVLSYLLPVQGQQVLDCLCGEIEEAVDDGVGLGWFQLIEGFKIQWDVPSCVGGNGGTLWFTFLCHPCHCITGD